MRDKTSDFLKECQVRRLEEKEIVTAFDCEDEDLNDFILNEAHVYRDALLAVTYILEDKNSSVLAYFSLANDKVSLSDFESRTDFNRFRKHRFVNEKRLKSYPAVKLCRFGVSLTVKGMGMGSILIDFIKAYFLKDNKTGCRFITVDAYSAAVPFYEKNGFLLLTCEDVKSDTRLLYFDLNDYKDLI